MIKVNRKITAVIALRFSMYFEKTAKFMFGMQNDFDKKSLTFI
jgi:plasmid maintenance system antidote protein VapI